MHAAPTAVLVPSAHEGQFDPLGKFTKHKRFNKPVATALMSDGETRDIGRAIANCASRLSLDIPQGDDGLGEPLLRGAQLCNRRLCPFCEWRRTRAWRARLIGGLNAFSAEQPKYRGVFLTLTVRNCQLHELRETIREMHKSFKRLTQVSMFPTQFWMRRTEVTVNRSQGEHPSPNTQGSTELPLPPGGGAIQSVHPHMHCLLLVRPSYWSRDYITKLRWQQEWQMAARLDYAPIVDVRRARCQAQDDTLTGVAPVSAVVEAAKYATKATDLLALGGDLPAFHHEMRGLRLYGVSGALRRFISDADVRQDELLDTSQFPVPILEPALSAVAQWFDESQEYRFVA